MKKIICLLLLAAITGPFYAQLQKGRMFLGGNINFNSGTGEIVDSSNYYQNNTGSNSRFVLNFNYGYLITDRLSVGLLGSYSVNNNSNKYFQKNTGLPYYESIAKSSEYAYGLFARYYFMKPEGRFAFFAQLSGTIGKAKSDREETQINSGQPGNVTVINRTTSDLLNFRLNPGVMFFINNNFGIEASIGNLAYGIHNDLYYRNDLKTGSGNSDQLTANFSLSTIFIGLNYYFGGK